MASRGKFAYILKLLAGVVLATALTACNLGTPSQAAPTSAGNAATAVTATTEESATSTPASVTNETPTPLATDTTVAPSATVSTAVEATNTSQAGASDTPTAEATRSGSSSVSNDERAALSNMMLALSKVKSYRVSQVITASTGTITQSVEVVPPDKMQLTMLVAGQTVQEIIISDTLYTLVAGKWMKLTNGIGGLMSSMNFAANPAMLDQYLNGVTAAKSLGSATVNGVPTHVYQYEMHNTTTPFTATVTFWQGDDNLPYRSDSESQVSSGGKIFTATTSALYYDYNANIVIAAPPAQ